MKGGLGGRFNGVHIKDISKKSKEARASKAASGAKAGAPAKKPEAQKKFAIKASTAPEIPRPSARPTTPAESWAKTVPPKSKPRDWARAEELVARGTKDPKKFAPVSKIKEINSPLTSMVRLSEPLRVVKETARAVSVGGVSGVKSPWIPKSCADIKDGKVQSVKKSFFLEQFSTSMAESTKEALDTAIRASDSYTRPPAGFRRAKYPFAILRETDKAVGIGACDRNGEDELQWYPKSQVITHSGYVIFATTSILNAKGQRGGWTSK